MNRIRRTVLLCFLLVLSAGCTRTETPAQAPKPKEPEVQVGKPRLMTRVIEQPATIEAFEETPLVAHISGYIEKMHADMGQRVTGPRYDDKGKLVKPGQILAELSVPQMLRELEEKQALVVQAKAQVKQAMAGLDAAEAAILTAKAQIREAESSRSRAVASYDYWKVQYKRFSDAADKGIVEKQVKDETFSKYRSAEAYRDEIEAKVQSAQAMTKESEAKRNKAKADVDAAKARVLVTQAEEAAQSALVEYRYLRAPFDGVVTRRHFHTGHFLQPGGGKGPSVVFVVARTAVLRICSEIPESEAQYITNGMKATFQPPILKDQTFHGEVARTSTTLDARSRTLRVEIDYDNKEGKLRPGMYANLTFNITFDGRWLVPASAIFTHADQPCLYRVDAGKAKRTPVKLGIREGKEVEVSKMQTAEDTWEALSGKEVFVLAGTAAVSDGKEVPKAAK